MKRILTFDGGGVRGIYSLQILARIESLFRAHRKNPNLVLADEFDFFSGTSTGAMIAAGLSWGLSVKALEDFYLEQGEVLFARESWNKLWKSKYKETFISDFFKALFCEDDTEKTPALLGSNKLKTLLLIVTRNASTGSPWPVTNNPNAMYNQKILPDCNLNIPLWQLLRASTAAPAYFPPQEIEIGDRVDLFLDGAVTQYNNPSMITLLTATLPQYNIGWETGRENIHLISIGTGKTKTRLTHATAQKVNMIDQLGHFIPAILASAIDNQDMMCRVMGDCLYGETIDSEIGDLRQPSLILESQQLFTYVRYNHLFDKKNSLKLSANDIKIDNLSAIPLLQELGQEYAENAVKMEHLFPGQKTVI
ncbi:MAG: patatin-like phospholipase family protein [Gammaproteobacteria bacterium]|nr:patatin-like phospholipase family protein [Gammaproteobacteria bacterium]